MCALFCGSLSSTSWSSFSPLAAGNVTFNTKQTNKYAMLLYKFKHEYENSIYTSLQHLWSKSTLIEIFVSVNNILTTLQKLINKEHVNKQYFNQKDNKPFSFFSSSALLCSSCLIFFISDAFNSSELLLAVVWSPTSGNRLRPRSANWL